MLAPNTQRINSFNGLHNTSDPLRLGLGWLVKADNVNITDSGAITKRAGYTLNQAGAFASAFSTFDFSRMYVSVAGAVKNFAGVTLYNLTSTDPLYWCEINNQVFFNNGVDAGIINSDDSVIPWRFEVPKSPSLSAVTGTLAAGLYRVLCTYVLDDGRETGASDPVEIVLTDGQALQISTIPQQAGCATNVYICPSNSTVFSLYRTTTQTALVWNFSPDQLGIDFQNDGLDPLPIGIECIQAWRGRIYASQYMPTEDQTVIWFSEPLAWHLFHLGKSFIMVPGHVLMLAPHDDAMLIGTDSRVYAYDGQKLDQVAAYGVVPGQHWAKDEERTLFWTTRGLCSALPFTNLTERQVSVAPGVRAGGCLVRDGGQKRYLAVIQQGGTAFNPYP